MITPELDTRCPHERGECADYRQTVPNYQPIDYPELSRLIEAAVKSENWQFRNQVQIRIGLAIPGMTCPRPAEGPVSEKESKVFRIYVDFLNNPGVRAFTQNAQIEIVDQIWEIIQESHCSKI